MKPISMKTYFLGVKVFVPLTRKFQ